MKKKLQKSMTERCADYVYYFLAFAIPVLGMLLILKSRGFYPFKEDTLFILDMKDQFMEFYASLRYILSGDNSIAYSWSRSLGGCYTGLYAYYLANPLSWVTVLFPIEKMYAAVLVLTLLKIGCCGLTFSVFAAYLWKRYAGGGAFAGVSWHRFILLPFAVSYALMSYNIVFSSCLMWLDGVIMLPLVIMGVEKLLEGRKGLFYLVSMTAACVFNYYTAYMIGLFTVFYFLARLAVLVSRAEWKRYLCAGLRLIAATLLALGLSAPLLAPAVMDLASGKLTVIENGLGRYINFPFLSLFGQFTNGAYHGLLPLYAEVLNMPNVYCGYTALLAAVLFCLLRKISLREKLAAAVCFLGLLLSFYLEPLNLMWHGFAQANGYYYRHSFVVSFFVLCLAVRAVCAFPGEKLPAFWRRWPVFGGVTMLVMGVVALDMGLNGRTLFFDLQNEFNYDKTGSYEEYIAAGQPLTEDIKNRDSGFYRINQWYEYSKNDAMLYGYNGMTHYSSTFNAAVNSLTRRLGFAQDWLYNTGYGSTPLTDSLLAVKYVLADTSVPEFYDLLEETDFGTASYVNQNALSIACGVPVPEVDVSLDSESPFENQNALLNGIAGTQEQYFVPLEYAAAGDENAWSYTFTADSRDPVYLYMHYGGSAYADVYVNGEEAGQYFTSETKCIKYLGSFEPGQQVCVEVVPAAPVAVTGEEICRLREDVLVDRLRLLQEGNMQVARHGGGKLSGTIHVPEGGCIVTSIPYENGWQVKVDGKKAETGKYADTFIMVEAQGGEHSIEFSYVLPGSGAGALIFLISAALSVLYFRKIL